MAPAVAAPAADADGDVHGNRHGKVSRVPGYKGHTGMHPASIVPFASAAKAHQAGYRKTKDAP
jgi:hypothetical protein